MSVTFMDSGHWLVAGWTMLHFLWLGGIIGLLAGASRLLLRSARPNVRYVVALGWLAALTVAPLAITLAVVAEDNPQITPPGSAAFPWPHEASTEEAAAVPGRVGGLAPRSGEAIAKPPLLSRTMATLSGAARYLPWIWVTGAPLVFLTVATGLAGAERLSRQSRLLDRGVIPALCGRLLASLNVSRRVAVGVCDRLTCPVLIGILRPVILLPPAALMGWNAEQLEMILLHELAHVRRWDNLVNLLQRIIESLLFFHPVVWLVSRWARAEREQCCDQAVLAYTRQPRAYAELLASMVLPVRGNLALVAMGEANVVTRIRRVLKLQDEAMKLSHKIVGLLTCGFIATAILIGTSIGQPTAAAKARLGPVKHPSTTTHTLPTATGAAAPAPEEVVTLRLLDPDGKPVKGANVALRTQWKQGEPEFYLRRPEPQDLKSGEDGRVRMPWVWFANQKDAPAGLPVLAMHVGRQLSGLALVPLQDRGLELTVQLQPSCRVRFRLDSSELRQRGIPLVQAKGHILVQDYPVVPLFGQIIDHPAASDQPYDFEYLLPPGRYSTWAFGDADGRPETEQVRVPFEITQGQPELDLGPIDLPPTLYSLYYGQAAPELVGVKDLRTNAPLTLENLKGKMVILCFAPYGCAIGDLQALREKYKQNGLEVVVIHSPESGPAELEQAKADTLLVQAIDGRDSRRAIYGRDSTQTNSLRRRIAGATAVAYGLQMEHMLFLIDREGRLVQRLRLERATARTTLDETLGLPVFMNRRPQLPDYKRP